MHGKKIIPLVFLITLVTCDYSGSDIPGSAADREGESDEAIELADSGDALSIPAALQANGFTVNSEVACDGSTGYLAENGDAKRCIVLQGSPRAMGFQMGSLLAQGTQIMTTQFIRNIAASTLGLKYESAKPLFDFLINEALTLCKLAVKKGDIPQYLVEEMRGIVEGASSQGHDISFDDVLLLNCGSDSIYSIIYTGTLPSMKGLDDLLDQYPEYDENIKKNDGKVYFPAARDLQFGCNSFIVTGEATDGGTYHGRDFMYSTGGIYQDHVCLAVYLPDSGNPFVSVTAPGWVCAPTAMNSRGLSMGVDVAMGEGVTLETGIGCLLVVRDTVQNSDDLDQAVARVKALNRGVPWLYTLADDTASASFTNGVILETGRSGPDFTGPDLLPSWERWYLSGATCYFLGYKYDTAPDYISRLDGDTLPERGVMARAMDWEFPDAFRGIDSTVDIGGVDVGISFPEQGESWPDTVLCTNHYVIPRMRFTSLSPWMMIQPFIHTRTSGHRYEKLLEILSLERGSITIETATDIIDYLNPNSVYRDIVARDYYEPGSAIGGHHALIDNGNRTLRCLWGYYAPDNESPDIWAAIDLRPFLDGE